MAAAEDGAKASKAGPAKCGCCAPDGGKRPHMVVPRSAVGWAPIPVVSWIFPFVGHAVLCKSSGATSEFAGPYYVHDSPVGTTIFGRQAKYLTVARPYDPDAFDAQIEKSAVAFSQESYNFITNNCHDHVCHALNAFAEHPGGHLEGAGHVRRWTPVVLATRMFFASRFINWKHALRTYVPFAIFCAASSFAAGPASFAFAYACASLLFAAAFALASLAR